MARETNSAMDDAFRYWLKHKGINLDQVLTNYMVEHKDGQTQITFTMVADDFPVWETPTKKDCECPGVEHWSTCPKWDPPVNDNEKCPHGIHVGSPCSKCGR